MTEREFFQMALFYELLRHVDAEIKRMRRRHAGLYREISGAREAICHWTLLGDVLHWHVALEDAVEPEVDVEIAPPLLIVRAHLGEGQREFLLGVLPVPTDFDVSQPVIRYETGHLEIRLVRAAPGKALP